MFARFRGTSFLSERNAERVTGPALPICQDALSIGLATESGEHINKCGPIDSPDLRFPKSSTGTVTFTYADVEDKKFAIGMLGTVVAQEVSPSAVTAEVLPDGLVNGDIVFLGGLERNRNITSPVITDSATAPTSMVLDTDYTLDAGSGKVTFLDVSGAVQPFLASYSKQNPAFVSFLSAAQKEYKLDFEAINTVENNQEGGIEIYRIRFDPATNADFLSDDAQLMELVGTMLADPSKPIDSEFGQFGRRVLSNLLAV